MEEQVYHILIKKECAHFCPMCCNKMYDIDNLPTITGEQLKTAHTVCLTGGEPFLIEPRLLIRLCYSLRSQYPYIKKLYIYSSGTGFESFGYDNWRELVKYIDGLNVSPKSEHEWDIVRLLFKFYHWAYLFDSPKLSNRIYVFDEQWEHWEKVRSEIVLSDSWQVIGRKWDKEFKTPENEHFVRLPIMIY